MKIVAEIQPKLLNLNQVYSKSIISKRLAKDFIILLVGKTKSRQKVDLRTSD